MENDCQILSIDEKTATQANGWFDKMTVLSGFKSGCLKHRKISSLHRLYKLAVPSWELVAKYCMSWWMKMLVTWSSWSKNCFCFWRMLPVEVWKSGWYFQTMMSPDLEPVITVQISFWMLAAVEFWLFFETILLASSTVDAMTVHVDWWALILEVNVALLGLP